MHRPGRWLLTADQRIRRTVAGSGAAAPSAEQMRCSIPQQRGSSTTPKAAAGAASGGTTCSTGILHHGFLIHREYSVFLEALRAAKGWSVDSLSMIQEF